MCPQPKKPTPASWRLRPVRKRTRPPALTGSITTVLTDAPPRTAQGSTTTAPSSHADHYSLFSALNTAGFSNSLGGSALPASHHGRVPSLGTRNRNGQTTTAVNRQEGVNGRDTPPEKGSDSRAVGHPRPSRVDRTQPSTCHFSVGVAGFEPTASIRHPSAHQTDPCPRTYRDPLGHTQQFGSAIQRVGARLTEAMLVKQQPESLLIQSRSRPQHLGIISA
jgi:hypothetical protein